MELIIDATEIFIALTGYGITKEIIFSDMVKLYAPEYLFDELNEHKSRIKEISKLSENEFEELVSLLKTRIKIIPKKEFDIFLSKADELIADQDDTEYLALSLSKNNMPIWSEDHHFKEQLIVKIFTTKELVDYLKSLGYNL